MLTERLRAGASVRLKCEMQEDQLLLVGSGSPVTTNRVNTPGNRTPRAGDFGNLFIESTAR